MTVPQIIYLVAVAVYLVFFCLFLRFFFWKAYADSNYWRKKPYLDTSVVLQLAESKRQQVPFISLLVPARNEADVIARTIEHMASLNYSCARYELIVVTDEKELQAREDKLPEWIMQVQQFAAGEIIPGRLSPQARRLVLGWLSRECVSSHECWTEFGRGLSPQSGVDVQTVAELAEQIVLRADAAKPNGLGQIIDRTYRHRSERERRSISSALTSFAAVCALAYCRLASLSEPRSWRTLIKRAAEASHTLDSRVLVFAHRMASLFREASSNGALCLQIEAFARECLPTTQDITEHKIDELRRKRQTPEIRHVTVPYDFDGKIGGRCVGTAVASTKGRALNYALSFVDSRSEMCGFYDAESRPDPDVLLYVAYRRLADGSRVRILQGPVFQVRNFYQMGAFCKIASLYQAIAHDWYMPALFKRLPFVGGTNLYADRQLLTSIGGYDHAALTEDLELGARAYLLEGAWPEYLPYYSSEQTPPTFCAFFRQRLRWGTGHLQVMDKIRADDAYPVERKRPLLKQLYIKGQLEWAVYQGATFVPPVVLTLWYNGLVDPYVLPECARWVLNAFSATYVAFTVYAYYRYHPYVDNWARPQSTLGRAGVLMQLLFLPLAAFFFPVPYSSAMVLKALGRHPKTWTKTPRTRE